MNGGLRIIGGQWKGRKLAAPAGLDTRPTSARARQAVFDILLHAPWGGAEFMRTARVLDVFAGTGAYGLEALSRGAIFASFVENDFKALAAIRANVAACRAEQKTKIFAADVLRPPAGAPHNLTFLDPPYGQDFVPKALAALAGWVAPGAIIVAELGPDDSFAPPPETLAERKHGKARLIFWRNQP
jgi:16S rRNA (guanine966-N2)-methyltransferase